MYNKEIAIVYDKVHQTKNYVLEAERIKAHFSDNISNVLDIGCGTGGHSVALAKLGYKVTGVDPSKYMIDIAKQKSDKAFEIDYKIGFLEDLNIRKHEAAVSMFNVVNHILDFTKLQDFFAAVSNTLNKSGVFVFDCFNQVAVARRRPNIKIIETGSIYCDYDAMSSNLEMKYSGNIKFSIMHKLWSTNILNELAVLNGFTVTSIVDQKTNLPATCDSYKITFVCKKDI